MAAIVVDLASGWLHPGGIHIYSGTLKRSVAFSIKALLSILNRVWPVRLPHSGLATGQAPARDDMLAQVLRSTA